MQMPNMAAKLLTKHFLTMNLRILINHICVYFVVKTPINEDTHAEYEFTWYEGNCNDEQTQQQIIQNTIDAINSGANGVLGTIFSKSQNITLTTDHFEVFCGPKVCCS